MNNSKKLTAESQTSKNKGKQKAATTERNQAAEPSQAAIEDLQKLSLWIPCPSSSFIHTPEDYSQYQVLSEATTPTSGQTPGSSYLSSGYIYQASDLSPGTIPRSFGPSPAPEILLGMQDERGEDPMEYLYPDSHYILQGAGGQGIWFTSRTQTVLVGAKLYRSPPWRSHNEIPSR